MKQKTYKAFNFFGVSFFSAEFLEVGAAGRTHLLNCFPLLIFIPPFLFVFEYLHTHK